ncbi:MFS transporter [Kineosporia sp. R_H_3]|uniref:MFS transporter n=1 Tax=Kineosporia sp. R_H_3 TaxID=1961848 RepID=UPI00350EDD39
MAVMGRDENAAETTAGPPAPQRQVGDGRSEEPDPRRWRAFTVCLVAGFMSLLDVSIVNVALPSLREGLDASQSQLQWVVSGYALAFGLVLVPAGRLGDVRGRRGVFVAGLVLFTVSSAVCGLAPGAGWLVAARLVQGAAGGLLNPQVSGFVQELFSGRERGKAFGLLGATIGLSTAVGPLTGGALIAAFGADHGWRAVFFVNVPVGVVAVVLALRLLPRTGRRAGAGLDPVGVVLLGAGVLAVLLPVVQDRSWPGGGKWALVPVGLVLLAAFVVWERRLTARGGDPMVDLSLFRRRSYALGAGLGLVYFGGFTAIFFVLALYLQSGLGYSAFAAGLAVTPFALGSAVASWLGGRFVTRVGRPLVASGLAMVVVGLVGTDLVLGAVGADGVGGVPVGLATVPTLLLAGVGSGLVISPNITLTLSEVPVREAGSAGGVLQTGQRIGAAVGIAVVGAVFFSALARSGGDWDAAVRHGLWVSAGVVAVALLLALADLRSGRRATA